MGEWESDEEGTRGEKYLKLMGLPPPTLKPAGIPVVPACIPCIFDASLRHLAHDAASSLKKVRGSSQLGLYHKQFSRVV